MLYRVDTVYIARVRSMYVYVFILPSIAIAGPYNEGDTKTSADQIYTANKLADKRQICVSWSIAYSIYTYAYCACATDGPVNDGRDLITKKKKKQRVTVLFVVVVVWMATFLATHWCFRSCGEIKAAGADDSAPFIYVLRRRGLKGLMQLS